MPGDTIQEAGDWQETTRRTRQVKQGKGKIQQEPRRGCRNGRWYPGQAKENDQVSNSDQGNNIGKTSGQKQRRPTKEVLGG